MFWAKTKWTYVQKEKRNVYSTGGDTTAPRFVEYLLSEKESQPERLRLELLFSFRFLQLIIDYSLLTRLPSGASHGVPAPRQVVHREEGADWRGAADPPRLSGAGVPPQATGVVGPAPQRGSVQVAAVPLVGLRGAAGEGVRLIHSALRGTDGLPARAGRGQ